MGYYCKVLHRFFGNIDMTNPFQKTITPSHHHFCGPVVWTIPKWSPNTKTTKHTRHHKTKTMPWKQSHLWTGQLAFKGNSIWVCFEAPAHWVWWFAHEHPLTWCFSLLFFPKLFTKGSTRLCGRQGLEQGLQFAIRTVAARLRLVLGQPLGHRGLGFTPNSTMLKACSSLGYM